MSENFTNLQWLPLSRVSHFRYKNMDSESFVKLNGVCLFESEIEMDLFRIVFLLLGKCNNGSAVYIVFLWKTMIPSFYISPLLINTNFICLFFFLFFFRLFFVLILRTPGQMTSGYTRC